MATVTRLTGDLGLAEDAVQDACAEAVTRWPREGVPTHPQAWLVAVARHKALDRLRREGRRGDREAAAARRLARDVARSGGRMTLTGPWPPYNFVDTDRAEERT